MEVGGRGAYSFEDLCTYCRARLRAFAHTHAAYPHMTDVDIAALVDQFARQCCTKWRGSEPAYWFGRLPE